MSLPCLPEIISLPFAPVIVSDVAFPIVVLPRKSAVVGVEHPIKGQGIYAFVTLMNDTELNDKLQDDLKKFVANEISPIAKPDLIQFSPNLPKTRSGKIMRRILRKVAANEINDLGDVTTLADSGVLEDLIENRLNLETN